MNNKKWMYEHQVCIVSSEPVLGSVSVFLIEYDFTEIVFFQKINDAFAIRNKFRKFSNQWSELH